MKPELGQHVKCLLVNNLILEGIVEEWSDNIVRLQSLEDKSISIIHHPERDIIITKIIIKENFKPTPIKNELEKQFIDEYNTPSDGDFRVHNLAKLKTLIIEQDKKIISEKLKEHQIGEVRTVKYGHPGFLTQQKLK